MTLLLSILLDIGTFFFSPALTMSKAYVQTHISIKTNQEGIV